MNSKTWQERWQNDSHYIEGLIAEINEVEDLGFFIAHAVKPGEEGFQWVCGGTVSKYFPTSKDALIGFLRVAGRCGEAIAQAQQAKD